jgi:hypothetical protein
MPRKQKSKKGKGGKGGAWGDRQLGSAPLSRPGLQPATGGEWIIRRKLPEMFLYNNASFQMASSDPTGTCLFVGSGAPNCPLNDSYDYPFSMLFRMDQLLGYSNLVSIADYYRIRRVNVRIFCSITNTSLPQAAITGGTFNNFPMPQVTLAIDYDDATVPAGTSEIRERMDSRLSPFVTNKSVNATLQPRCAEVVYSNAFATTNGYSVSNPAKWLNTDSPNVEHYGLKGILAYVCGNPATTSNFKFDVDVEIGLRGIR